MSVFVQRLLLLLLLVVLQHSFLDILWPSLGAPVLLIAASIAIVFLTGFAQGIGWVVLMVGLSFLLEEMSFFPVFAVGIAYGASFLSRRLRLEDRIQNIVVLSLVAAFSALLYRVLLYFFEAVDWTLSLMIWDAALAFLVFPIVFGIIRRHEEYIKTSLMSEFRGLRS
ncbi:MAG: hypothetical protein WBO92_02905 [Candidatus Moraniibacteriota bacterium]